jgi:catalase (peroxidase I)
MVLAGTIAYETWVKTFGFAFGRPDIWSLK